MTALTLFLLIILAIAAQLGIFLAVSFWRHWRDYRALRSSCAGEAHQLVEPLFASGVSGAPAWQGLRPFRVVRKEVEDRAGSVCSFYLEPLDGLPLPPYEPGQYLTFTLELGGADGRSERQVRCYSLSDSPDAKHYRVTIKRVEAQPNNALPAGRISNYFLDHVVVGSVLQVSAPAGHFVLADESSPCVFVAGGIGITPLLGMLNTIMLRQPEREVWLFYGVRHGSEVVMRDHLVELAATHKGFQLRLCFSAPAAEEVAGRDFHHHGRVDVALLRNELPLHPFHFYVCGPAPMMESLIPALEAWGVEPSHIHYEAFGPASIKRRSGEGQPTHAVDDAGAAPFVVTFRRSGKQLAWQPQAGSLLEFAEANGIELFSGCRAGSCGTCQTTILAGEVRYLQQPDFDPEPGRCLLCIAVPMSDVTLEA